MTAWVKNLEAVLERKPVVIICGNVRDKYIDEDRHVYENLTGLLKAVAARLQDGPKEMVLYDYVSGVRNIPLQRNEKPHKDKKSQGHSAEAHLLSIQANPSLQNAGKSSVGHQSPEVVLARWVCELRDPQKAKLITINYLDKLVPQSSSACSDEEKRILLWLEKIIENINLPNRLILIALQESLVPVELYINSPKVCVLPIPLPDQFTRELYLKHRLPGKFDDEIIQLVVGWTEGLFLRDLDNIITEIERMIDQGQRFGKYEICQLLNKYRLGEQEDYWGRLSIDRLKTSGKWFVDIAGVKGQDEAIIRLFEVLCLARAGLTGIASGTTTKPKGVLFFAGPSGVGKTFLAKKLAEFLFHKEDAFLRYDMSEYKEEHTVSKFIGSPPGYVGYERGGKLTNDVRQKPFSVILFDEIEKAHPKIMDIFLQIIDEGRLTDSRGQTVYFTETVIIFTSNIGTRSVDSRGNPIDEKAILESILRDSSLDPSERKRRLREHFIAAVEKFFRDELSRPELLNRIGYNNIVVFNYINDPNIQKEIVTSHLKRIRNEFNSRYTARGYKVDFAEEVVTWLVEKYSEKIAEFGGRAITNVVEQEIMVPLAIEVLSSEYADERGIVFVVGVGEGRTIEVRRERVGKEASRR